MKVVICSLFIILAVLFNCIDLISSQARTRRPNNNVLQYTINNGHISPRVNNPDNLINFGGFTIGVRDQNGWHAISVLGVPYALSINGTLRRPLNEVEMQILLTKRFPSALVDDASSYVSGNFQPSNFGHDNLSINNNRRQRQQSHTQNGYSSSSGSNDWN